MPSPLGARFKFAVNCNRFLHAKSDQEMRVCRGSERSRKRRNEEILPVSARIV